MRLTRSAAPARRREANEKITELEASHRRRPSAVPAGAVAAAAAAAANAEELAELNDELKQTNDKLAAAEDAKVTRGIAR